MHITIHNIIFSPAVHTYAENDVTVSERQNADGKVSFVHIISKLSCSYMLRIRNKRKLQTYYRQITELST